MRYSIGDLVRVRPDFMDFDDWDEFSMDDGSSRIQINRQMRSYAGEVAVIAGFDEFGRYMIDLDGKQWHWTDEMFEDTLAVEVDVSEWL